MYKKVSVVLGALALMVALGFGASQSIAAEKVLICHFENGSGVKKPINVTTSSAPKHMDRHEGDFYIGDDPVLLAECLAE